MLLKMQKELLDTSGSEFVLINKVGVGAVNGLNSCQVAGSPVLGLGAARLSIAQIAAAPQTQSG